MIFQLSHDLVAELPYETFEVIGTMVTEISRFDMNSVLFYEKIEAGCSDAQNQ